MRLLLVLGVFVASAAGAVTDAERVQVYREFRVDFDGGRYQEALPLAYRCTLFRLDDMDDLITLLIAVGYIGRDNIQSLEFPWESKSDSPMSTEHSLTLPVLHVVSCVQLLGQCKNLKFLRLFFDSDLLSRMSPDSYKTDAGIRGLFSVRGIERLEVYDLGFEPLDQPEFVRWLRESMQRPNAGQNC